MAGYALICSQIGVSLRCATWAGQRRQCETTANWSNSCMWSKALVYVVHPLFSHESTLWLLFLLFRYSFAEFHTKEWQIEILRRRMLTTHESCVLHYRPRFACANLLLELPSSSAHAMETHGMWNARAVELSSHTTRVAAQWSVASLMPNENVIRVRYEIFRVFLLFILLELVREKCVLLLLLLLVNTAVISRSHAGEWDFCVCFNLLMEIHLASIFRSKADPKSQFQFVHVECTWFSIERILNYRKQSRITSTMRNWYLIRPFIPYAVRRNVHFVCRQWSSDHSVGLTMLLHR